MDQQGNIRVMLGQPGDMPGAQDTIYLCNFRVSVDGDWLCLKQLDDVDFGGGHIMGPLSPPSPVEPFALLAARDPVLIERSNLVNISKLVVKELIETSHQYGRMLDTDHLPLQHFFIVLEHVLRHGLRPKKGLLGPKKELWDILQLVEKYSTEAADTTASVRDLPTVTTAMGRARAWVRIALMQKKLADYLKILVDRKDQLLAEYFEPDALLMSDEAFIIIGLLVGLNVVDCNLCLKEEELDCQQGVIDFSLYLRSSHHYYQAIDPMLDVDNMTTVLDQKNYIEELNRHLNATVTNLEAKVESLQTTNALIKEDLDRTRKNLVAVTEERKKIKPPLAQQSGNQTDPSIEEVAIKADGKLEQLKAELESERKQRQDLEKELKLQVSMKSEMEVAMKLLEKDIHEKQDTIVSLRKQLEDIKTINLEMFKKLQDCESSLKQKTKLVFKLEEKTLAMHDELMSLEDKLINTQQERDLLTANVNALETQKSSREAALVNLEGQLQAQNDIKMSLEKAHNEDKQLLMQLNEEVLELRGANTHYLELREKHSLLTEQCRLHEQTLEELGTQLSLSKLKVSDLQEEAKLKAEGQWASDKEAVACRGCEKEFSLTRRKHHCRNCGDIFCNNCSDNTTLLPSSAKPVRICDSCHYNIVARDSVL